MTKTTVHRSTFRSHFTTIPNSLARDRRLNFRERGIMLYLLSHSGGYSVSMKDLEEAGGEDGESRDSIRKSIKKLEALGYGKRRKIKEGGKFVGVVWDWYDTPINAPTPTDGIPSVRKPAVRKPSAGNTSLLQKEQVSEEQVSESRYRGEKKREGWKADMAEYDYDWDSEPLKEDPVIYGTITQSTGCFVSGPF